MQLADGDDTEGSPPGVDIDALLARLDADQYAAVTAPPGPVAVIAGAGSGKTRVLTSRIAYRIAQATAQPKHIVAFTFTRQAAWELRRRLFTAGVDASVVAGTFHSVAYRILRRRWDDRGRQEPPTLATSRLSLLTEMLEGNRQLASTAVGEIDWARARLVRPDAYATVAANAGRRTASDPERVGRIYADFETYKRKRRVLDFDDLLSECIAEIQRPGVADAVAWWHRHLHVDEFQDINPLQYAFLEALRNGNTDLFVVGDPAQAIYGWNGADPTLLEHVQRGPLSPITILLPTNYRSTPQVVAAGDRVLAANRVGGEHVAQRPDGPAVQVLEASDEHDEARGIVRLATTLRPAGARWSSIAVLGRTHETLRVIAETFASAGIPTRVVTRRGSGDDAPAAMLRTVSGARSTEELHARAVDLVWPNEVLSDGPDDGLDAVGDGTEVGAGTDSDVDAARALIDVVREFEEAGGGGGRAFTAWAELQGMEPAAHDDAVELVTMHAAKGREWPSVIVCGVDTVGLPVPSSPRSPARAEEARLLYVALTRAEDRLFVTWARKRRGKNSARSPLLPELNDIVGADASGDAVEPPAHLTAKANKQAPDPRAMLFTRLRDWRASAAKAAGVAPSFVLDDTTLERIVDATPATEAALASIEGVGPMQARRIASRVLPLLSEAASSRRAAP